MTGLCKCGCGQRTNVYVYDDPKTKRRAGDHRDFVHGHYSNWKRLSNPSYGKQFQRTQLREKRRIQIVRALQSGRIKYLEDLLPLVPEFRLEGISMMINLCKKYGHLGPVPDIKVRRKRKAYKSSKDDPWQLVFKKCISLDRKFEDDGSSSEYYEVVASDSMNPLEALMMKEESEHVL